MIAALLLLVVWVFGLVALLTWPVMLLFGVIHASWASFPALGYWTTFAIVLVCRLLFGGGSSS